MKRTSVGWGLLTGLLVLWSPALVGADPLDQVVPELVGFQSFDLASDGPIAADGEAIQFVAGVLTVAVYRLNPTPPPIHAQPNPPPIHYRVQTSLADVTALHLESGLLFTAHGVGSDVLSPSPPPISPVTLVSLTRLFPIPPPISEGPTPPPIRFIPAPPPIRLLFSYELTFQEGLVSIDDLELGDGAGDIVLD